MQICCSVLNMSPVYMTLYEVETFLVSSGVGWPTALHGCTRAPQSFTFFGFRKATDTWRHSLNHKFLYCAMYGESAYNWVCKHLPSNLLTCLVIARHPVLLFPTRRLSFMWVHIKRKLSVWVIFTLWVKMLRPVASFDEGMRRYWGCSRITLITSDSLMLT